MGTQGVESSNGVASSSVSSADAAASDRHGTGVAAPITNFVRPTTLPKYFGVDVDGTFLAEDPAVHERNLEAFARAVRTGVNIFFCTGRAPDDAMRSLPEELCEEIGFTGYPGVYYNGGAVFGRGGKILKQELFRKDILKRIADRIVQANHQRYTMFLTLEKWYVVSDDWSCFDELIAELDLGSKFTPSTIEQVMDMDIMKVIVLRYAQVAHLFEDMADVDFVAKCALNDMTDLNPLGITKGSGLALVLAHLGGTPEECGYVGDAINDVEAMRLARHSFAVGNAKDSVKACAKYVVQATNEEGAFRVVMDAVYGGDYS
ncbi:HAD superfamily hydrolase, putative [Babesia caballi]|uniref:HAD superfamily hydrolase, putative n=1 Tax=Babesia caballi TaxID=5871 RepID=A0AAV4LZR3_BABCB|nr:HAD superfamily hydrolase, putative [Babesia caballi]